MTNETFSDRLKLAMQAKQADRFDPSDPSARCKAWEKPCQPVCQRKNGSALRHSSLSGRCAPGRSRLAACKRFHSKLYGRYGFRSGRILF